MTLTFSEQQATGIERFELLGDLHGVDVFDMAPLEMTRMGTLDDPISIYTLVRAVSSSLYITSRRREMSCRHLPARPKSTPHHRAATQSLTHSTPPV